MASISVPHRHTSEDDIWVSLKQAITNSSGFQRWHAERTSMDNPPLPSLQGLSQEQLVRRYLRETLETLAY